MTQSQDPSNGGMSHTTVRAEVSESKASGAGTPGMFTEQQGITVARWVGKRMVSSKKRRATDFRVTVWQDYPEQDGRLLLKTTYKRRMSTYWYNLYKRQWWHAPERQQTW